MRLRVILPLAAASLASCATPLPSTTSQVQAVIRRCGLQGRMTAEVTPNRELHILYLDPETDYRKVDCFLTHAKRRNLDMGFVGNEAIEPKAP